MEGFSSLQSSGSAFFRAATKPTTTHSSEVLGSSCPGGFTLVNMPNMRPEAMAPTPPTYLPTDKIGPNSTAHHSGGISAISNPLECLFQPFPPTLNNGNAYYSTTSPCYTAHMPPDNRNMSALGAPGYSAYGAYGGYPRTCRDTVAPQWEGVAPEHPMRLQFFGEEAEPGRSTATECSLSTFGDIEDTVKPRPAYAEGHHQAPFGTDVERPLKLSNEHMLDAYIQGRLCLSCDSLEHPMPKCPNGAFVCPNCHRTDHRGSECLHPCRFCTKSHMGISIMHCLKVAARAEKAQLDNLFESTDKLLDDGTQHLRHHSENDSFFGSTRSVAGNSRSALRSNSSSGSSLCQSMCSRQQLNHSQSHAIQVDTSTRPDNSFGRTVWISRIPMEATDEQLIAGLTAHLSNGGGVFRMSRKSGYEWAYVEMDSLTSAFEIVAKRVTFAGRILKVQFRKSQSMMPPQQNYKSSGSAHGDATLPCRSFTQCSRVHTSHRRVQDVSLMGETLLFDESRVSATPSASEMSLKPQPYLSAKEFVEHSAMSLENTPERCASLPAESIQDPSAAFVNQMSSLLKASISNCTAMGAQSSDCLIDSSVGSLLGDLLSSYNTYLSNAGHQDFDSSANQDEMRLNSLLCHEGSDRVDSDIFWGDGHNNKAANTRDSVGTAVGLQSSTPFDQQLECDFMQGRSHNAEMHQNFEDSKSQKAVGRVVSDMRVVYGLKPTTGSKDVLTNTHGALQSEREVEADGDEGIEQSSHTTSLFNGSEDTKGFSPGFTNPFCASQNQTAIWLQTTSKSSQEKHIVDVGASGLQGKFLELMGDMSMLSKMEISDLEFLENELEHNYLTALTNIRRQRFSKMVTLSAQ